MLTLTMGSTATGTDTPWPTDMATTAIMASTDATTDTTAIITTERGRLKLMPMPMVTTDTGSMDTTVTTGSITDIMGTTVPTTTDLDTMATDTLATDTMDTSMV